MGKWLEVIEVQTGLDKVSKIKNILHQLSRDLLKNPDLHKVKIFHNHSLESDFSIHLVHRSTEPGLMPSIPGLHIAASLREYGLMNHQVWCEMKIQDKSALKETR